MAFFKFRKDGDASSAPTVQPESVERMRQRAKNRLIGASVLVLIGVIGFPLLFDQQPRPIAVDLPIDIPDKNKVAPLALVVLPALAASTAPAVANAPVAKPQSVLITEPSEPPQVSAASDKKQAEASSESASGASKIIAKEIVKPAKALASTTPGRAFEADKAQALLDGAAVAAPVAVSEARFVVQVGAFADPGRARDVRKKVEHAGLKTYTHVAETKDGKRIRVRVGPFVVKAEAEKAAEKIKKLNLPATLLTL